MKKTPFIPSNMPASFMQISFIPHKDIFYGVEEFESFDSQEQIPPFFQTKEELLVIRDKKTKVRFPHGSKQNYRIRNPYHENGEFLELSCLLSPQQYLFDDLRGYSGLNISQRDLISSLDLGEFRNRYKQTKTKKVHSSDISHLWEIEGVDYEPLKLVLYGAEQELISQIITQVEQSDLFSQAKLSSCSLHPREQKQLKKRLDTLTSRKLEERLDERSFLQEDINYANL